MISRPVDRSTNVREASDRTLAELKGWIDDCMARYAGTRPTDGHDQLTYTTGWEPYIAATGDASVISFLKGARDQVARHFSENGMWKHGYWRRQEAHHGTEHFELFTGFLFRVDPGDETTKAQLLDAAEHIGNWIEEIPPWFDERTGLFRSFYLGTEHVGEASGEPNVAAHLRYVNLCLIADEMSGDERYLRFAERYLARWAEAIVDGSGFPRGLSPSGPVYLLVDELRERYGGAVGQVRLDSDLGAVEALLASDGIGALLKVWQRTGRDQFLRAAERVLDAAVTQVGDPDAGVVSDAIRRYRQLTGLNRYDDELMAVANSFPTRGIREVAIEPEVQRTSKPPGIGKRSDMPLWYEDGQPRRYSPITLGLAAEIARDETLATWALDIGRTYLSLAREAYPDGREHGCAARSVSAIARGHGRDNHAGVTTSLLAPLSADWESG